MKKYCLSILKHFIFWFILFAIGRALFLLFNFDALEGIKSGEILLSFTYALRLDLSAICWIMVIPFILITLLFATQNNKFNIILKIYSITIIIVCLISIFSDIAIYSEWANKLNYKALQYLKKPAEAFKSSTSGDLLLVTSGSILFSFLAIWCYLKFIINKTTSHKRPPIYVPIISIVFGLSLMFIGIRGGLSQVPISQSAAYFSKHQILNDTAVNVVWNLMHNIVKSSKLSQENPFVRMSDKEAQELVDLLYEQKGDTTIQVINNENINIILIVLESWSADLIETLTGETGITPNFHNLEKEGLLFTKVYANGHRSQQGISALLSGFPPIPVVNITDNIEKYKQLNSLNLDLKSKNFNSSFYFGGDLVYGNLKSYLMSNQFDLIVDEQNFPKDLARGKLTIFDEYVLDYHLQELSKTKEPFFSMLFTGSTHSPYDEPKVVEQIEGDVSELPYLNSAKYTDYCLGKYFEAAKKCAWYNHTLFILISDHSHRTHKERPYHSTEFQHIPMLWLGGALKEEYCGKTWDKLCSQIDLPLTLLHQLGIKTDTYQWSQDIFDLSTHQFAAYETPYGLNWIRNYGFIKYDGFTNSNDTWAFENDSLITPEIKNVQAYLQILYKQYLSY